MLCCPIPHWCGAIPQKTSLTHLFSGSYRKHSVARCMLSLSSMKITNLILQKLSQQVVYGNPWWGLVVANEYLSTANPLHKALVRRFHIRLGSAANHKLEEKLVNGLRYCDLSPDLRALIGSRESLRARDLATSISPRKRGKSRRPIKRIGTQRMRSHDAIQITKMSYPHVPHAVQVVARTAL